MFFYINNIKEYGRHVEIFVKEIFFRSPDEIFRSCMMLFIGYAVAGVMAFPASG